MRALVLGGTGFVGRHTVDALRARGHEVTLFRRGLSNPGLFRDVEQLTGDRDGDLGALRGRRWDVVVDPSGYQPRQVRAALAALDHPDLHYLFVSSISVYTDWSRLVDEDATVYAAGADDEALGLASYGRLKAGCERAAVERLGAERVQQVRAGAIVGPHDYDPRFPWWLRRLAQGGEVLAPGAPDDPVQLIDVRDLAAWMVACAERRVAGTFNATSRPLPRRVFLDTLRDVVNPGARFTWVGEPLLVAHAVQPTSELPFWAPAAYANLFRVDVSRAVDAGLGFRPFAETVRDTWAWLERDWAGEASVREHRALRLPPSGLSVEREAALLSAERLRAARPG